MRGVSLFVLIAALAAPALAGQERPTLESRLDPAALAALRPIFEAARRDSLPVRSLEDKALEGTAKRVPVPRILTAVRRLAAELRDARALLLMAVPDLPPPDADVVAAAAARRQGVPGEELAGLRQRVPRAAPLEIPFALLGDLVQRGVAVGEARAAIEHMVISGVPQHEFVEIPARVDAALRRGAPPGAALGSALAGLGIPPPPARGRRPVPPR